MALPLLVLLQGCGSRAGEQAERAKPPAPHAAAAQQPSAAAETRAKPQPARTAAREQPDPPPQARAAPRPASRPEAPAVETAILALPLPSDPLWVAPDLKAAPDAQAAPDVRAAPLPPDSANWPRLMTLQIAPGPAPPEPQAADEQTTCDCTSLTCPTPVEACLFILPPDPNTRNGLLDPDLAGAV